MEVVAKMLGLAPDASEAEVALTVAQLLNKKKNDDDDKNGDDDDKKNDDDDKKNDDDDKKSKKKNDDAEDKKNEEELDALRAKLKKAEEELDKMRAKNKAERTIKAAADVDAAIKAGKIKAEAKDAWVALLEKDEAGAVINMINDLPVNKVSNKITSGNSASNSDMALTNVVALTMANKRIENKI